MSNCLVVGGGLIGLLTARELALRGMKVTLMERGKVAQESSWAGGGILSPLYPWRYPDAVIRLATISQQHFRQFSIDLQAQTGIDPQWCQSGLMMFNIEDSEQAQSWASQQTVRMMVSGHDVLQPEHCLSPDLFQCEHPTVYLPDVAQIRNPRFAKAVQRSIELLGVELREHTEMASILMDGECAVGVMTTQDEVLYADHVVVAGGAWSAELMGERVAAPDVMPVRGQMLLYKTEPGFLKHIVMYQGYYLIPRMDGHLLVGSTLEYTGFDKSTTKIAYDVLCSAATGIVPALKNYPIVKHWAGLRPGSTDSIPTISKHPAIENLYVNAGHFRNGVVTSLASAQLMADIVMGENQLNLDASEYGFSRS